MLVAFIGLWKIFRRLWIVPEFRALIGLEILLVGSGTAFYHFIEGWDWLDAAYFCVVTLATVGYGDFHPTTPYGRFFTMIYIIFGVALLGVFIQLAGRTALEGLQESARQREKRDQKETNSETPPK
jgi:voltage-gated potassium channel